MQQFADALESLADLPGLGPAGESVRDLAEFLKGEKSDAGGGTSAGSPEKIAVAVGTTRQATGGAAGSGSLAPDHAKIELVARALQKKAMDEDYLSVNFDKAADKLNQAVTKCGANHCVANLRALVRRDLAVVYSAGNKKDLALAAMVEALKADGTIQLDPNFKTKEIEAIYNEAKKSAGGGGAAVAVVSSGGGAPPAGDFTHTPADEQAIRTPLPIYVEYGGSETIGKVVVKYKAFGMPDFKTFELKKLGDGWGGSLPCTDMLEGDLQYYLQGFSPTNDPVATGGDRNNTYKVSIRKALTGEAPHLPGQVAPTQCAESADCPPDFPGCKKGGAGNLLGVGADCAEDAQCKSGTCKEEKCSAPPDGGSGERPPLRHIWIGAGASFDLDFISGANNVCQQNPTTNPQNPGFGLPLNAGYYCTFNGGNYPASVKQNQSIVTGTGDGVSGGPNPGNLRFLASFDYALNYNLLLGARFGYGLFSYPGTAAGNEGKSFPPIYLEGRATLIIGQDAIAKSGFAPVIFLGAGAAQFSSSVPVQLAVCATGPNPLSSPGVAGTGATCTTGAPFRGGVTATAWRIGGPVFVGPGGGVRFAFSPQVAAILDVKLALAFGSGFLFVPSPELGVQFGF